MLAGLGAVLAGCATLSGGARDTFARHLTCPPERVRVTARSDVAPHTFLGSASRTSPPPEVAADASRLSYFKQQQAQGTAELDASCDVFAVSGCGKQTLLCCSHDVDDDGALLTDSVSCEGPPGWSTSHRGPRKGTASGDLDSQGPPEGTWHLHAASCEEPRKDDSGLISTVLVGDDGLRIGLNLSRMARAGLSVTLVNLGDPQSDIFAFEARPGRGERGMYEFGDFYLCSSLAGSAQSVVVGDGPDVEFDGTLELTCQTKNGSKMRGSLVLSHCPY